MKVISPPAQDTLSETEIYNLYPQLFSEIAELSVLPDAEFILRYFEFIANLERDFVVEEQWMEQLDSQLQREHRAEHAQLLGLLHHAQTRMVDGDCSLGRKIIPLLTHWFTEHIATMDTAWALAMARRPASHQPLMRNVA